MDSRLQYHEPEKFWKVFKLWGDPVNIREQQDAFDFFQALIDQIDEQLKVGYKIHFPHRIFHATANKFIAKYAMNIKCRSAASHFINNLLS
ncbi:hypothetical protein DPMN_091457 [Dreissena polymorpha]|uniref:Uncharacterized protein n=1 Tax=Dreissena polymorpha TaxID=45954 RepID=A0A9D4KZJ7_DREPO|nr:hypothetical protein DPMN_091457 [Dreissena polymorpha]